MDARLAAMRAKAAEQGRAFGPPLAEAEIRAFERRHGIELPEGFRRFLQVVGNGGDGPPTYGLTRLGEVPDRLHPDFERDWRELPHIAEPFPLTEAWGWEGEEYDEARRDAARHGSLNLGHDGCGMYWLLIVTGRERGQVWAFTDVGVCPQEPRRDFLQWVEAWLDGVWWWA
jgi:SMI1 / KNR4 family (SUKH-1)